MGVSSGDPVVVSQNGTSITAPAAVRSGVPEGTVFMATGLAADSANSLAQAEVEVRAATTAEMPSA
jgi:anaerobic selenocysteine-containing dehydrogenase